MKDESPVVLLRSGRTTATVAPAMGGRCTSLQIGEFEVLTPPGDGPLFGGMYPMAPWAGRLRDGALSWSGETATFPTHLTPPHAIHGTLLERHWAVSEQSGDHVQLEAPLELPWPFGGRVLHEVVLHPDALECHLRVEADDTPFPAIVGWHPWFRRHLLDDQGRVHGGPAQVMVPAGRMLSRGPDGLPDGSVMRPIPEGPWDDCFTELAGAPSVTWPGALRITVASTAPCFVIFTERSEGVCIEPQTGPPNGLNDGACRVVAPGAALVASMTLRWELLG